jgi:hypothetical protein
MCEKLWTLPMGRGGVFLKLTEEQYAKLRKR